MINEFLMNVAKIFFGIGILLLFVKLFSKQKDVMSSSKKNMILYNLHKALFGLSTILGFIHGLTIMPINLTYIITGWLFGILMILLCGIGIRMGFKNQWKPYTREQKHEYKKIRLLKWGISIMVCAFLGMHYLL